MDFSFNEDQNAIRDLAAQIFTDRASDEFLLEFARSGGEYDEELWSTLGEQGLLAICIPENYGGSGLGFTELCLILEEQGRRVAPVPLFSSLVLGGLPIAEFGSDEQKQRWLTALARGEARLTAAIADLGMAEPVTTQVTATRQADGWLLNGVKGCVADGASADCILIPALSEGSTVFFLVEKNLDGVTINPQQNALGHWQASVELRDVRLSDASTLGDQNNGETIMNWIQQRADTALCAMQIGVCEEALKRTAQFTSERKQFGMPIGSFQAVAMRAADAYIDIEAMRSTYWEALYLITQGKPSEAEVRAAKWWACEGSHKVVHATQHLHGGMGSDIEFPIHRFFLWAKHLGFLLGGKAIQTARLGALFASNDELGAHALKV